MTVLFAAADAQTYAETLGAASSLHIAAPTRVESMLVVTARRGEIGRAGLEELLGALNLMTTSCDTEIANLAYDAWLRFGKGRHPAGLNFGDGFSYALARVRGEPLLFKGDDFALTDVTAALSADSPPT